MKRFVDECVTITPGTAPFPPLNSGDGTGAAQPFRIAKYETTQELYQAVTGANPSRWKGPRNSVETVSWLEATAFCRQLTALLHAADLISKDESVRLPTSAEWEYCCRAGTDTQYSFGDAAIDSGTSVIDQFAWHTGNAAGNDPAVGVLRPNAWDLYDVHGYLWEYTSDQWQPDAVSSDADAIPIRTMHGGSWRDHHLLLSSSSKLPVPEYASGDAIGFRCVIAKKPLEKETRRR
ncbi:MAG: SUMF1/EgtB/PvdO family nonheme iron enzyme [Planctomycetaceae bacterium]